MSRGTAIDGAAAFAKNGARQGNDEQRVEDIVA